MLLSTGELLARAKREHYAVGQFNLNSLVWCREILLAAQELQAPVILGATAAACSYMAGMKTVLAMAEAMCDELGITVPVALHLDHASKAEALYALQIGWRSVMYDGSHESFETNRQACAELVLAAESLGASVEAELGAPSGFEEGVVSSYGELASPYECKLLRETGILSLAAGIGNCHGEYPIGWKGLDFMLLSDINSAVGNLPLVLHGGSGIPEPMIKRAIENGVAKINVNTECQTSFAAGIRRYVEEGKDLLPGGNRVAKLESYGYTAMRETVRKKMTLFGSVGKARLRVDDQ